MANVHYGLRLALGGAPETWQTVHGPDGLPFPGLYHPEIPADIEHLGLTEDEARRFAEVGGPDQGVELVEIPRGKRKQYVEALDFALNRGRAASVREVRVRPGEHNARASDEYHATSAPSMVEVDPTRVVTGEDSEPYREVPVDEAPAEGEEV